MGTARRRRRKQWLDKRSRKLQIKWYARKRRTKKVAGLNRNEVKRDNNKQQYTVKLPGNFSLINNTQETIECFNGIMEQIEKKKFGQHFFLDATEVKYVTIEALMYVIAIVYNIKANRMLQYSFEGNLPQNEDAREIFKKSGYLNYFKMKKLQMPNSSDCVQIVSGARMETNVAKDICDFVIDKLKINRSDKKIKILYRTLVELMSNTAKHAYQNHAKKMVESWYLYAVYEDDKVRFSFVDTGDGIPSTIKKKILEKINFSFADSQFIKAAFTEEGRSETGLSHRGKGLPQLYEHVKENEIIDFFVLSGAGSFAYNRNESSIEILDYPHRVYGTIFSFAIRKENAICI